MCLHELARKGLGLGYTKLLLRPYLCIRVGLRTPPSVGTDGSRIKRGRQQRYQEDCR